MKGANDTTSNPLESSDLSRDDRLQAILNSSVDGIVIINEHGKIVSFNRAAEEMFGYGRGEVLGKDVAILMPPPYASEHKERVRNYVRSRRSSAVGVHREVTGQRKDGTTFSIDIALGLAHFDDRKLITGVVRDITEKKATERELENYRVRLEQMVHDKTRALERANRDLEKLSQVDGLTEVFNRRYFDEVLDWWLSRASRSREPIVLILCDIDCFKQFNDTYGHVAGDNCLKQVAAAIRVCCRRETDVVTRYGGEEFAVLLPGSAEVGSRRADHIRHRVWDLHIPHGTSSVATQVTVSLGVASIVPGKRTSARELIERADRALYQAKNLGRNRVVIGPDASGNAG